MQLEGGFLNVIGVWNNDWMLSFLLSNKEVSEVKHRIVAHIFTEASRLRPRVIWNLIYCCQLKMSEHLQNAAGWRSVSHHYLLHLLEELVASGRKVFFYISRWKGMLINTVLPPAAAWWGLWNAILYYF